jgi:hypothetical protein
MRFYFTEQPQQKQRGKPKITLPVLLHQQLAKVNRSLRSINDLYTLQGLARHRKPWQEFWKQILSEHSRPMIPRASQKRKRCHQVYKRRIKIGNRILVLTTQELILHLPKKIV